MEIQQLLREPVSTGQLLKNLRLRLEDMDAKAAYLLEYRPETVRRTVEKAEMAYKGMLKLPGTGGVEEFVGNPPCWLERRHNDNEFLWQLNRMTHWQDLLEAYSLTKQEKYAKKVLDELLDWIQTVKVPENLCDYPLKYFSECNPHRALELGIRNYKVWPLILEHLGKTEYFTEEILEKYLLAVYHQIKALRKVSEELWPNADHNHFLMECLGILTTALYFPELKEAKEWRHFATDGLERCARAQLTEDGGQIEGCPSYHNGCMFWFGMASILAKRFGFELSEEYMELFRKNMDYSIYSLRPTGKCVPVGDSHANSLASMAGVYSYLTFDDLTWLGLAANFIDMDLIYEEADKHAWRALDLPKFYEDLKTLEDKEYVCDMPLTFWNKKLGQAVLRSDWTRDALSFLMTCRSPVQNAHAHIDLMSFDFSALGKNMICDPGIFCYREDEDRRMFKSTAYHSTIVIDDENQFEYVKSFEFGPQRDGMIYAVEDRGFYSVVSAEHNNYEPVTHQRHMALVDKKIVVIVDVLGGLDENDVKRYFHLDYTEVEADEKKVLGKAALANLAIYSYPPQKAALLPGRMSDTNDIARPATRVMYQGVYSGEKSFVTVLVPFEEEAKAVEIKPVSGEQNTYEFYGEERYQIIVRQNDIEIRK